MADQPGVWGIDVGQCALKAIRVELIDGKITATAFDYVEHAKILSQPDADPDQLTREALEKFLSRNVVKGDTICISVPGQSGLARFVKLPPVEEKKIVDIVRFEAKQQIPFNLDEVVWDYQKIGSGVVTDGFAMETEIGLFAMKRDMINRAMQHFKDVNVEVHVVQMAPLALCNYVAYDLLGKGIDDLNPPPAEDGADDEKPAQKGPVKKHCIVALDIGADSSNLVITDGERIIWQRPIPLGGNNFTRVLTKDLKLTFAKAEHLKRNATKSPDLKKILAALKPVLNDFVGEVQRSLGYFTNTHRDAQIEYLIGLGSAFRLPGLQRFLGEKLQLDVRKLGKFERLEGDSVITAPQFTENILSFAVAYGLAQQGLKQTRLQTNLLPPEIRMERLIRAKKPWAIAAAAALLFGVAGLAYSYHLEINAVNVKDIQTLLEQSKKIEDRAKGFASQFQAQEKKVKDEEEAVKSVIAGQDERMNWIALNKFINDVLPRPDDKLEDINLLLPEAKTLYWNDPKIKDKVRAAHKRLRERQALGTGLGGKDELGKDVLMEGIEDLVQLNIEAVDCRFIGGDDPSAPDLKTYWTNLTARNSGADLASLRPLAPKGGTIAPPEGKGWVVELRGYTYHQGTQGFVIQTLVENIARMGIPEPPPAAPPQAPVKPGEPPVTPPPAVNPSAPPVAPPPGTPAPPTDGKKDEPVIGKISHVLVFRAEPDDKFERGDFKLINTSVLPRLLVAAAAGGVGGEGSRLPPPVQAQAQAGRPATVGRTGWVPLGGASGAPGEVVRPATTPFGSVHPTERPFERQGDKPEATQPSRPGPKITRTEFIILFIWKEPVPSEKLRPAGDPLQQVQ